MWLNLFLVLSLNFSGLLLPLASQEASEEKREAVAHHQIVVMATRLETSAREVGSSLTIITAEALDRTKKTTLTEILEGVVGAALVQNGGPGGAASLFIRGANSEHTLFLIDGVELNDPIHPSRAFDFSLLTLENIERVEILRGPQSPLYGSDALGGVVNLITRRGSGKPTVKLKLSGGSYGTLTHQSEISGFLKGIRFSFGLQNWVTQGISSASSFYPGNSERDANRSFSLSGRLNFSPFRNFEADFIVRSTFARLDIDNFGGPYGDDPNHIQHSRHILLRGQVRALFLKNRWEQKLAISLVDSRRNHDNPADELHPEESESGHFQSQSFKLDWQNNLFLNASHTLTLGVEHEQEQAQSEYLMTGAWGSYSSDFPFERAKTTGLYVQDHIRSADRFFVTVGFRHDHHSRAGEARTFRLAPAYLFKETQTKIKGSIGTGFKSPSLYQLYAPATFFGPIGNLSLRPEKTLGWDIGIEQPFHIGRVELRLATTYFDNDFKDLISFDAAHGYVNIGKAESKGVEMELEARWARGVSLNATYVRLEARDKIQKVDLLRRPKSRLCLTLSQAIADRWNFSLSFYYTGERSDTNYFVLPARNVVLAAYSLLNGLFSLRASSNIELFVRLDNIFNTRYEMIFGYGTLGFSAQAGVKISL